MYEKQGQLLPWIASWFRVFKYDWLLYQDVQGFHHLEELIGQFVEYYNHQRHHEAFGYVTLYHRHTGQDQQILETRRK